MGKARSFRLTKANEVRLEELINSSHLDNANRVFNDIIENYHTFKKFESAMKHFQGFVKEIGRLKK